jgi:hypothetical protein
MKPKFPIERIKRDDDGYRMIEIAASILNNHGLKKEAKAIHQEATVRGYDFYFVLKLIKKYMEV